MVLIGMLFIASTSSLLIGVEVAVGLWMPAIAAELFFATLRMASPFAHGFGWIAITENIMKTMTRITCTFVNIFFSFIVRITCFLLFLPFLLYLAALVRRLLQNYLLSQALQHLQILQQLQALQLFQTLLLAQLLPWLFFLFCAPYTSLGMLCSGARC